jgi:hypothetical protein
VQRLLKVLLGLVASAETKPVGAPAWATASVLKTNRFASYVRYAGKSEFRLNGCDSPVLGNMCQGLTSSDMSPLRYVNLIVTEIPNRVIRSLNDSGSQLTIVNKKVLEGYQYPVCGVVKVRGLFGSPVDAELSQITLAMSEDTRCTVRVMCAVSGLIHEELIVPADVIDSLNDRYNQYLTTEVRSDCVLCDDGKESDVTRHRHKTDEVVGYNFVY